jgi:hypothetical protein
MRDSSITHLLLALLVAGAPVAAAAHGHGGGHHGSGPSGGFVLAPIVAPRLASPGFFFGPPILGAPVAPGPLGWSWGPGVRPGPPVLGWPSPGDVASPGMARSEAARESDLDQQISALPPAPDPPAGGAVHPPDSESDGGWQPL